MNLYLPWSIVVFADTVTIVQNNPPSVQNHPPPQNTKKLIIGLNDLKDEFCAESFDDYFCVERKDLQTTTHFQLV
ncbi:MAG: hypothetical protein M3222_01730 [Thermoproteota archaeon]|nr:hypothetical protein [Thermoproteota archaeon]